MDILLTDKSKMAKTEQLFIRNIWTKSELSSTIFFSSFIFDEEKFLAT
jgi:hypothetical protein